MALTAAPWAALWTTLLVGLSAAAGCSSKGVDRSPTGVVKRFVAASFTPDSDRRHKAMYELLGPRTRARLEASARSATAATAGRQRYAPHQMLSASFRPGAKGSWLPRHFKLLSSTGETARVEVRGDKDGQVQVVDLVKTEGRWRLELPLPSAGPAATRAPRQPPNPSAGP